MQPCHTLAPQAVNLCVRHLRRSRVSGEGPAVACSQSVLSHASHVVITCGTCGQMFLPCPLTSHVHMSALSILPGRAVIVPVTPWCRRQSSGSHYVACSQLSVACVTCRHHRRHRQSCFCRSPSPDATCSHLLCVTRQPCRPCRRVQSLFLPHPGIARSHLAATVSRAVMPLSYVVPAVACSQSVCHKSPDVTCTRQPCRPYSLSCRTLASHAVIWQPLRHVQSCLWHMGAHSVCHMPHM
jgi:hypothetical protein